jgi:very-short-patch-repair endonuclease
MDAPRRTKFNAKRLRREMSLPEVMLWLCLRAGQLDGLHFRKQHPIGSYVLDFYCAEHRLAVEVDGELHCLDDRPATDTARDAWLAAREIRTLRLTARDVLASPDAAALAVLAYIREDPLSRSATAPPKGEHRLG